MILASRSPRRRELLSQLGLNFSVMPVDIDEGRHAHETAPALVERLAKEKAQACLGEHPEHARELILAADTIIWTEDGIILGKPRDDQDARETLQALSGATHHVSTGVCLLMGAGPRLMRSFVETTDVEFYPLTESEIDAYVRSGEPRDKAGSYGIQGIGRLLVKGIRGDYCNVVGLPVSRLARELDAMTSHNGDVIPVSKLMEGASHAS